MSGSWLPNAPALPIRLAGGAQVLLDGPSSRVCVDASGLLTIGTKDGVVLVRSMALFRDAIPAAVEPHVSAADGRAQIVWDGRDERAVLTLEPAPDAPGIDIIVEIEFREDRTVTRDALVLEMAMPLVAAIRPNGRILSAQDCTEAWLGKGGVAYGSGDASLSIVHPVGLSSLQIGAGGAWLWLNLDWAHDHPHVVASDTANWADASAAPWGAGTVRRNSVRLHVGALRAPLVRPLLNPNGALAAFAWTEHACNCDLRTHRAVYFGDSGIVRAADALGGFVKHAIPTTKSVFYDNPVNEPIAVRNAGLDGPMVAIRNDPAFRDMLFELRATGRYEIIPHGIQPQTADAAKIDEGTAYMQATFGARNWIDHSTFRRGVVNGGRDGYLAFGLAEGTPDYRADIWRRHGIRYFWNHALEYIENVPRMPPMPGAQIRPSLVAHIKHAVASMLPARFVTAIRTRRRQMRKDQHATPDPTYDQLAAPPAQPVPFWWRHPRVTADFVNWGSRMRAGSYFRPGDGARARAGIDGLIDRWGVNLHHCYPTRVERDNGAWQALEDGRIAVSPEFDAMLAHMAARRDEGMLNVTTAGDLLDRWVALEQVRIDPQADGTVVVCNLADAPISGLSFAVRGRAPVVDGKEPAQRKVDADTVFWFDLPARGTASLSRAM